MSTLGLGCVKTVRPRETGDAKLNLACYRNCELESTCACPALRLVQRQTEEARGRAKDRPHGSDVTPDRAADQRGFVRPFVLP
jgi:hypothetical protein